MSAADYRNPSAKTVVAFVVDVVETSCDGGDVTTAIAATAATTIATHKCVERLRKSAMPFCLPSSSANESCATASLRPVNVVQQTKPNPHHHLGDDHSETRALRSSMKLKRSWPTIPRQRTIATAFALSSPSVIRPLFAFFTLVLLIMITESASSSTRFFMLRSFPRHHRSAHANRRAISQLVTLDKPASTRSRVRRSKTACSVENFTKPGVQEAVFKMIIGVKTEFAPLVRGSATIAMPTLGGAGDASCSDDEPQYDDPKPGGGALSDGIEISPDMPLEMRAVCGFAQNENINERRIPRAIREVKCLCKVPQQTNGIRCEPLFYNVPVLMFDETCTTFREESQPIAFACVPVLMSQAQSGFTFSIGSGRRPPNDIH